MHARIIFWGVGGLLKTLYVMSTFLQKGKKSINAKKKENAELTLTQVSCGRLCVLCE